MRIINYSNKKMYSAYEAIWGDTAISPNSVKKKERIRIAVLAALAKLSEGDQYIIKRYHFDGASILEIADEQGVSFDTVAKRHSRALRRLRSLLAAFAASEFRIPKASTKCVICSSPYRSEIDVFLAHHVDGDRYQNEMREIKMRFGVSIVSVMTIVSHRKYH